MWTNENIPDQSGRTAIITGGNSGIGFEMAKALYQAGARVIIAGRDPQRINLAAEAISENKGKGSVETAQLDLSSLANVRDFAASFTLKNTRLDLLINNAGIMVPPQGKTAEGYELQFGVNFLGHFALSGHLYPLMKVAKGARVVTLSSGAHKMSSGIDFENLKIEKNYDAFREYATSKLADLQFMLEYQRRLTQGGDDIISLGAHPGVTQTELSRNMSAAAISDAVKRLGELMPAWQGALPALYAATAPDVTGGSYFGPDGENELRGYPGPAQISEAASKEHAGKLLWQFAEQVTGVRFP